LRLPPDEGRGEVEFFLFSPEEDYFRKILQRLDFFVYFFHQWKKVKNKKTNGDIDL